MPAGGLLALLDDVATLTKIATKKVSGVVGDDLALNAKTMIGIAQDRELPLIREVAAGSFKNKVVFLLPAAVTLSIISPAVVQGLLVLGGIFLCFEGVEKLLHKHGDAEDALDELAPVMGSALEKEKVNSAIKTDLILSAEIMVLALNTMLDKPWYTQVAALLAVSIAMTVGVYGAVAGLLRADNLGLHLIETAGHGTGAGARLKRHTGRALVNGVPYFMKLLSVVGTLAMFSVGGGIVLHSIPAAAHAIETFGFLANTAATAIAGVVTGLAAVFLMKVTHKPREKAAAMIARALEKFKKQK